MNSQLMCLIFITLSIIHCVCSQNYPYIGECEENIASDYSVTFICVEKNVATNFFTDSDSYCKEEFLVKSAVDVIKFQNCELSHIPNKTFEVYKNVEFVDLSNIGLTTLKSTDFNGTRNLKYLSLAGNKITFIEEDLFQKVKKSIVSIDLSNNQIDDLHPSTFGDMEQLKKLNLSNNKLGEFPMRALMGKWSDAPSKVEVLDLSNNKFSEIPTENFKKLREVRTLNLSFNKISDLPSFLFSNMQNLREIDLSHNRITNIDKYAFAGVLNLRKVSLAHNQLQSLDRNIFGSHADILQQIEYLDVSFNRIAILSVKTMTILPSLIFFDFSGNPIQSLNNKTLQQNVQLRNLSLAHCNLTEIESEDIRSRYFPEIPANLLENCRHRKQQIQLLLCSTAL